LGCKTAASTNTEDVEWAVVVGRLFWVSLSETCREKMGTPDPDSVAQLHHTQPRVAAVITCQLRKHGVICTHAVSRELLNNRGLTVA
jgi:hypothetical protein